MRVPLGIFCKVQHAVFWGHYIEIPQTEKVINKRGLFLTVVEPEKFKTNTLLDGEPAEGLLSDYLMMP